MQEVSDAQAYDLLEALAAAVADELLRRFSAERAVVRVTKPGDTARRRRRLRGRQDLEALTVST